MGLLRFSPIEFLDRTMCLHCAADYRYHDNFSSGEGTFTVQSAFGNVAVMQSHKGHDKSEEPWGLCSKLVQQSFCTCKDHWILMQYKGRTKLWCMQCQVFGIWDIRKFLTRKP